MHTHWPSRDCPPLPRLKPSARAAGLRCAAYVLAFVLLLVLSLLHLSLVTSTLWAMVAVRTPSSLTTVAPRLHAQPARDCRNTSRLFDSRGNPCVDLPYVLPRQHVFRVRAHDVTYMYCAILKTGCTYHFGIMQRALGNPYTEAFHVHQQTSRVSLTNESDWPHLLLHHYPRYVIVRNPLHRTLSAYLDKVERRYPHQQDRTPRRFRQWVFDRLSPRMRWAGANPHWTPQTQSCGFMLRGIASYFQTFKFEQPDTYLDYLEANLPTRLLQDGWGGDANMSFRQFASSPRQRTGNTEQRFVEYVTDLELFDYLVEVYRDDVEILGYRDDVATMRGRLVDRLTNNNMTAS